MVALLSSSKMKSQPVFPEIFAALHMKREGPEYELAPPLTPVRVFRPIPSEGFASEKSRIFSVLFVINGRSIFDVVPIFCTLARELPPRAQNEPERAVRGDCHEARPVVFDVRIFQSH